ncbi:aldo/keto reductase [Brevibacterium sediminis]|uniref:Aldo/keto reductase n=1 Tax=Brevibacterium sediminis TaxID=1857024 RepID=A0A5C4X4S8_9MICO|nr:aldo/keto reductase [Brevibacterium sediminis]TNM55883.1 aldo/keto reductase [Brevibacterium sediminis]
MTNENNSQTIDHRRLGTAGPIATSPGLGAMSMSGAYGPTSDAEGIAAIHTYLDAGGTLIDTGDFYGAGHNEMLIGRALSQRSRDDVILSVKFGAVLSPDGSFIGFDSRPDAIRNSLAYSLRRLGADHVDVYRPARLDPNIPIEETVGAIAELVEAGYVRSIGLSEVSAETISRAATVAPISDLQIEYSLLTRSIESNGILAACRELGIGITAYGALAKGLFAGKTGGNRAMFPRFQGENLEHNETIVSALGSIASAKGITLPQLAIAWVAAQGDDIVPVVGSRTVQQVRATLTSTEVELSSVDLAEIDEVLSRTEVRGDRYPSALMAQLDSER